MYTALVVLAVLIAILLVMIVLIQNPKGGGLSPAFGGGTQMMGVQKTNDILERTTWVLVGLLMVVSLGSNFFINRGGSAGESTIQKQMQEIPAPSAPQLPTTPAPKPGQ